MRCCYNIPCWPSVGWHDLGWHDLHFHDKIALKIKWNVFVSNKKVLERKNYYSQKKKLFFGQQQHKFSFTIFILEGQIAGNSIRAMMTTLRFTLRPADSLTVCSLI